MRVLAVVPARGGSVGVPGKNLARVGGVPLVARAVAACRAAARVDEVVVSTDDDEIAAVATAAGARVVRRPAALAGSTASSESALLHALDEVGGEPEVTVFVQCTSPFIDPADVDAAVGRVLADEADSVFSAVSTHEFLWARGEGGATGVNHDSAFRPRRQDREPHYRETGAFYVLRTTALRERGHRFTGRVDAHEVPTAHAVEVDTAADLELVRALATAPSLARLGAGAGIDVDAVVTDFDGVHTDDTAVVAQDGVESVAVSRSDGLGIAMLRRAGVRVLVLSTETNPVVSARAAKLGVEVLQGQADKGAALQGWLAREGLDAARTAYAGNDVNDLPAMEVVGWPVAVPGSPPQVLAAARTVLTRPGGHGAVRELCDLVLRERAGRREEPS